MLTLRHALSIALITTTTHSVHEVLTLSSPTHRVLAPELEAAVHRRRPPARLRRLAVPPQRIQRVDEADVGLRATACRQRRSGKGTETQRAHEPDGPVDMSVCSSWGAAGVVTIPAQASVPGTTARRPKPDSVRLPPPSNAPCLSFPLSRSSVTRAATLLLPRGSSLYDILRHGYSEGRCAHNQYSASG